ncbi:MAG: single-stranded DNA-binding protein, partial [Candidatus Marinimicrobia bacterium]|nr:single-stranded DNA-binding protein [Candidatus Neomarinimicrobiota bacterium]
MQRNSINKVILVGHTGNKPEGRYTPSGTSTASFSLATNESWIDSDKGKQERTEWHNIVAWGKLADFATEYIQKGQLVYVEG